MKFLADTNLVSELMKPIPDQKAVDWLQKNDEDTVVSSFVLAEIEYGIEILPQGKRRELLMNWFNRYRRSAFSLPWDDDVAHCWAKMLGRMHRNGKRCAIPDSLIAATALAYDLTVATRNVSDFRHTGAKLINPFE